MKLLARMIESCAHLLSPYGNGLCRDIVVVGGFRYYLVREYDQEPWKCVQVSVA